MSEIVPLDLLTENEQGSVAEVIGPEDWKHRLQEMGLREGADLRVVQAGEPCIVALGGQRLSLRSQPGTMILVSLQGTIPSPGGSDGHP